MSRTRTLLICLAILAAGAAVTTVVFLTEPAAVREGATKVTPMLVEVVRAERGTYRPEIVATGTVEPAQDVALGSRVGGQVVSLAPSFVPGARVEAGEVLLEIDPADYEHRLQQLRSDLRQAESDLSLELGRQNVAQRDYELVDEDLADANEALVLRRPQLAAARARVAAARAAVAQGELDLERTRVRAPFAAQVLRRQVDVGSQVAPGDDLGRLVGLDHYWVVATVPLDRLRWLAFPDADGVGGAEARLRNRTAWAEGEERRGRLLRPIGALDDRTRLARVLVEVPEPVTREPALTVGEFVEVRVTGKEVADVVRLDRDHLRQGDTVWVMAGDTLSIRAADVVVRDAEHAYLAGGVEAGERVVVTNLATVTEGAPLRLDGAGDAAADTAAAEGAR